MSKDGCRGLERGELAVGVEDAELDVASDDHRLRYRIALLLRSSESRMAL